VNADPRHGAKRAGILGMGMWVSPEERTNDAWPASFASAFHRERVARRERDFTFIEATNEKRPYDELFVKHALPYDGDPFKGATVRRVTSPEIPTAVCDAHALTRALRDARLDPREVSYVLSSALVPDRLAPSNGPAIALHAGCGDVPGIGVEGFCSSAVMQLEIAAALVESGRARVVACVQSHHIGRLNDLEGATSPIFGDASTAFLVGEVPSDRGLSHVVRGGDGSLAGGVTYTHKDRNDAPWYAGDAGPIVPGTHDPAAARTIARHALHYPIETIRELCRVAAHPIDAVAVVAMMQPMVWYAPAIADGLGISSERVPSTYGSFAHIGGCAPVANLIEARRRGLLRSGAPVVMYAHGAGITRYAALMRWYAPEGMGET
jgi:3-oxoacyl-[acyl-carrier-protein] synthase-3